MADYRDRATERRREEIRKERQEKLVDDLAKFFMRNDFNQRQANALAEKLVEHNWRKHKSTHW